MNDEIIIDVVSGAESKSLVINDTRVAGNKAWGGGYVLQRFRTTKSKVLEALGIQDGPDTNVGSKWIPCSERLPSEGDEYYPFSLVTLDNGDVCLGVYRYDDKAWWTRMSEEEQIYSTRHKVLAWQPLPEPYKEGES